MANSITGIADDVISRSALQSFQKKLTPFAAFSTSFSSDAAKAGDTVSIFRETYPADAAATKATHAAYTIQDADSDAVEISLGQPTYVSWGLDDVEVSSSSILNMERYGASKGNHLANAILTDVLGQVTNANYGAAAFTGAATSFDVDDVFDLRDSLSDNDCPEDGRSLVLSNAYVTALLKDDTLQTNPNAGDGTLREGSVGRLAGFDVYESNVIPANGENLVGFACVPSAMAVATRYLAPQDGNTYSRAEALKDPGTGITLGLRDWYSNDTGVRNRVIECVHGKAVGISDGLLRIVSA